MSFQDQPAFTELMRCTRNADGALRAALQPLHELLDFAAQLMSAFRPRRGARHSVPPQR